MKLRQYKKMITKTIKQTRSHEILVLRFDVDKIRPAIMNGFMKNITRRLNNTSKIIAIPSTTNIEKMSVENLMEIRDMIDKVIKENTKEKYYEFKPI